MPCACRIWCVTASKQNEPNTELPRVEAWDLDPRTCVALVHVARTWYIVPFPGCNTLSYTNVGSTHTWNTIPFFMSSSAFEFLRADSSTNAPPRPARCPTCGCRGNPNKTTRNLVVCIDGTANKFGRKVCNTCVFPPGAHTLPIFQQNTNVVKLFEAVDCDTKDPLPEQCTYYSSGIGTRPRILDVFHRVQRAISDKLDMAIAW